jgi:hypothetical protein
VAAQEQRRMALTLGQDQELFPEIPGASQLAALLIQPTQAVQDREEFLCVSHLLT